MTYEEFKRELCRNISLQGNHFNRQVRILERGEIGMDEEERRFIRKLNLSESGCCGKMVRDDYLYEQWACGNNVSANHWKVMVLYEIYLEEGWQGVLSEIIGKTRAVEIAGRRATRRRGSYEENCNQLILRPLNYRLNREELYDCIYWRFGDIALVLHAQLGDMGGEYVTMTIRRFMIENWNVEYEKLLTNALLNTYSKMPPRLFTAEDIRFFYDKTDGVFMLGELGRETVIDSEDFGEGVRGYRLTTSRRQNGAMALFYPGVKERLAELLGGDYYVGFLSIDEAVIHPIHCKNPSEMKASIQRINAIYDQRDMLTNRVYRYCVMQEKLVEV